MDGKDWLRLLGWTGGICGVFLVALFILTGGTLEIERIFGRKAQDIRYQNRQASPEMIEGKRQLIDQAFEDYCNPNKAGFKVAAKRQILDAARELDDLSVLPQDQQELIEQLRADEYECPATNTEETK